MKVNRYRFYKIDVPESAMNPNQRILATDSRFGIWRNCLMSDSLTLHELAGRMHNWLDAPMPTEHELGFGLLRLVQEGLVGMTGNNTVTVKFIRTSPDAKQPTFAKDGDACADVYAIPNKAEDGGSWTIYPGEIKLIDTGLKVEIPNGWEIQVRPRSGLSSKGITVVNSPGTVDAGYRGEIKIILTNLGQKPFVIGPGERVAQFAVRPVPTVSFEEVEQLSDSARGTGGFGSTGR